MKDVQDAITRFQKKLGPLTQSEEIVVSGLADGYTIKEMAFYSGLTPVAVRVRLYRARRKLEVVTNANLVAIYLGGKRANN